MKNMKWVGLRVSEGHSSRVCRFLDWSERGRFEFGGGGCAVWWTVDDSGSDPGQSHGMSPYKLQSHSIGVVKPFTWLGAKPLLRTAYISVLN
ncbi:hypothetical protein PILCRDRAFT_507523 [Piloderma croceum F 1598]|uniref:Uncharacterized protein n=1 Tax=Piloderma croceum (strain F 1598) TaxID=765440 RepID=A0A0C3FNI4_PILCF|nr:hypothetical protein PILCRDRAFT_507523 [Piloderma croceum F 1598]